MANLSFNLDAALVSSSSKMNSNKTFIVAEVLDKTTYSSPSFSSSSLQQFVRYISRFLCFSSFLVNRLHSFLWAGWFAYASPPSTGWPSERRSIVWLSPSMWTESTNRASGENSLLAACRACQWDKCEPLAGLLPLQNQFLVQWYWIAFASNVFWTR